MANQLSKTGITSLGIIRPWHVTQSIDAFTGIEAYDVSLSGSFNMTGSINALGTTLLSQYDINTSPSNSYINLDDGTLTGTPITLGSYDTSNNSTTFFSLEDGTIELTSKKSNISGSILQLSQNGIRFFSPTYAVNPFRVTQINPTLNQWEATFRVNSLTVTGSLNILGTIIGQPGVSNQLTSSYALTASYALNSNIPTSGLVTSVNGVLPSPGGNVSVALSATLTGNSASLVISSSGDNTGSLNPGTLWVISGDGDPNNNGDAFIYTTSSITGEGQWLVVAPLDVPSADARYILKNGNDSHTGSLSITGSLNMTGSITGESNIVNNLTASYAISSSYSLNSTTSSLALVTSGSLVQRTLNNTTDINIPPLTFNASIYGIARWQASFTGNRTVTISNLTEGRSIKIYIRNTSASTTPRTFTIQASTTTSGHASVLCSRGGGLSAISTVSLANGGTATIWVANVGGNFVGSIS